MSVNTIHKLTNKRTSFLYSFWVNSVVEKGLMEDYIILKYPELVQVRTIEPDKSRKNYKILTKREAIKIINEHPYSFDLIELDIEKIKHNHLQKSIAIRKGEYIKPIRNRIFYFLSFLFLAPLFSKSVRIAIKKYIDDNINVITVITGIILILLTVYMISLMN